jgi:hypothetical protein
MENLTLPLITLISPLVGWLIWLTIKTFQNDKAIAVNTTNDYAVNVKIEEVKKDMGVKIDKLETHFDTQFDKLETNFSAQLDKIFDRIERLQK